MPVEIARLDESNYRDALPLLTAQFQEHAIDVGAALDAAVRGLVDAERRGAVLVAREGERAIGVAVLAFTWTLEHGGRVAWLDELFVVPARRESGIGSRLLAAAIEAARSEGALAIDLEVDEAHARAMGLYRRNGFRELGRTRFAKRLGD